MRSKVLLSVLGLGLIFFLSGCMLPPPEPSSNPHELTPLEDVSYGIPDLPETQALLERLNEEGYTPLLEATSTEEFLGTRFTFIPLVKEKVPGERTERDMLPPPRKVVQKENGSPDDPVTLPPSPNPESMAYVVHWGGSTIGVLPPGDGRFRVLYPDGERTYRVVSSPGNILEQLRKNERFSSFEHWLLEEHPLKRSASSPLLLTVSRAFLDETLGVIYILLTLVENAFRDPNNYIRTASEDEDLKPLREYLVLAKAIGEINGEVIIDPNSIWLLPRGRDEEKDPWSAGIPRREVHLDETRIVNFTIPAQLHVVHGFGEPPHEFGDLRPVGFVVKRELTMNWRHPLPMPSPSNQSNLASPSPRKPYSGKIYFGTELYIWGLADWGPENLVLRFEPQVQTTLAMYNAAIRHAKYGIVGFKFGEFVLNMAGFKELAPAELSRYKTKTEALISAQNGILTLNGIVLWEWMSHSIGLNFEQLHSFLLSLAEAIDAEDFEYAYNALLPQGLEKLEEYFLEHGLHYQLLSPEEQALEREKVKELIRLLALKYREVYLAHSGGELGPSGIMGAIVTVANVLKPYLWKLVEGFLISYMMDRLQPAPVLEELDQAIRIISETGEVMIELRRDISHIVLDLTFERASDWLVDYIARTPSLPPSLSGRRYSGILNEISLDYLMIAGKSNKDYAVLIAPVIALIQSYYEIWSAELNKNDEAFRDEAEQLLRTLEFIWAAGSDNWVLQGFFFDKTDPEEGVNLLISRVTKIERHPAPPGDDFYLKERRVMDLALVRYEHTADPELDTEEIVSWINDGVELVHRWAEEEASAGTGFDVNDPRGARVVSVSREIVAVIFEAEIPQDKALQIAEEIKLMDDELVLIMWKEEQGDRTVTHAVAVESHARDFETEEITEIGKSLTPWKEDEFIVEEEVKAENVIISGGNCSWERENILPMIDT